MHVRSPWFQWLANFYGKRDACPPTSIANRFPAILLSLILLFLISCLAAWGVHHTRSSNYGNYELFEKDGKEFLVSEFANGKSIEMSVIRMDVEPTKISRSAVSTKNLSPLPKIESNNAETWGKDLNGGFDNGCVWRAIRNGDSTANLFRVELSHDEPVRTTSIEFGAPITRDSRLIVCGDKLVHSSGEQMELRDIDSGKLLDSIPSVLDAHSHLLHLWGTRNLYAGNYKSKKVHLFNLEADTLRLIHEWDVQHALPFKRNGQAFIAGLLPDGKTIEVRSGKDGSVVNSYSVPSDPMLPLPVTDLPASRESSILYWGTIGIHTDVFSGRSIAIPTSFMPIFRDSDSERIIGITRPAGRMSINECVVIEGATDSQPLRFPIDRKVNRACILKDSGLLALSTNDHKVFLYELKRGTLVHVIDPFRMGFPINCLTLIAFTVWCIVWLRIVAPIHSHGWIDGVVCVLLFITYASFRFQTTGEQTPGSGFLFAALGVVMSSILLSGIWLCLGRNRLFLRATPVVQVYGLVIGLIVFWFSEPQLQSQLIPAATVLTFSSMIPFFLLRWSGVKLQNTSASSTGLNSQSNEKESSIRLRDIFFLTIVAAIIASILRTIPSSHWYGIWFNGSSMGPFLIMVAINSVCLAMAGLLALWTSLSSRSFLVRWLPWFLLGAMLVALCNTQYAIAGYVGIGTSAALILCLHAYRIRGWRFANPAG